MKAKKNVDTYGLLRRVVHFLQSSGEFFEVRSLTWLSLPAFHHDIVPRGAQSITRVDTGVAVNFNSRKVGFDRREL